MERLVEGRYQPGARISIDEIKTEFGVSKQPVMDAMRRLEANGLVAVAPQSGCRVVTYSIGEVRDFFQLFARVEGDIAYAAAERRDEAQLADLDRAWELIENLPDTAEADPTERCRAYLRLNRDYHRVIHEMAASPVMAGIGTRLWDLADYFMGTVGGPARIAEVVGARNHDHDLIRDAIREGRPELARAGMQAHIEDTFEVLGMAGGTLDSVPLPAAR